jgi:uncharacterized membrane protein YfcA
MHLNPFMILGSAIVGLLVGLTGAGGGALMTPMLILLFGVTPSSAISSDLVAAVLMRPVGAAVHLRKGTVNMRLVGLMVLGSVPMAFLGSYLLHLLGNGGEADQTHVEIALGAALLVGAAAMIVRYVLDKRSGQQRLGTITDVAVKPLPTIAIGAVGGLIVGLTSVGSGSLMIVLLLFVYPLIGANQLVGTDLTQAVPLTAAAALGALTFGHVEFAVTASVAIGSVPAVLVGSFLSSRAPDKYIRPVITFVILASGMKYVGVPTTPLGIILGVVLVAGLGYWLVRAQPWNQRRAAPAAASADGAEARGSGGAGGALAGAGNGSAPTASGGDGSVPPASVSSGNGSAADPDGHGHLNGAGHDLPVNGSTTADRSEPAGEESKPSTAQVD